MRVKLKLNIKTFDFFLSSSLNLKKIKLKINYLKKKINLKKNTVLRSPHVNKTARDQIELKILKFNIKLSFSNLNSFNILNVIYKLFSFKNSFNYNFNKNPFMRSMGVKPEFKAEDFIRIFFDEGLNFLIIVKKI